MGLAALASALVGVAVAGLAFPVVVGVGLAAKGGVDGFLALPSRLDTPALPTRSTVLAADGSVLATFYSVNRVDVPLTAVPVVMRQAIVAIEDSRFYSHGGVDLKGTLRAAGRDLRSGGSAQGGSTLTQQYVKNVLLTSAKTPAEQQAAQGKTIGRKIREARYALGLEQALSKDQILGHYLNIAYFGNGVYGIGTAANYYFNEPVEQLTLAQSATLAGVVENPARYDVASSDPVVRTNVTNRRNTVLGRMRDLGDITETQRAVTAGQPVGAVSPVKIGQDCGATGVVAPFFCQYVRHELEDTPVGAALGATRQQRQSALFGGGLTIQTSLDPRIQLAAQQAVDTQVPARDASGVGAVDDIVEPGTGAIRAMAVDRPYGQDAASGQLQINLATGGGYGVQPGSTFKVFFLATALQEGIPLSTTFASPAKYTSTATICRKADQGRPFTVSNAGDSETGTFDLTTATALSVNTYYAQLAELTGVDKPLSLAESLGVHRIYGNDPSLLRTCTSYLGSNDVSPLAMAGAYAAFSAHGLFCPPRAIQAINGPDGKKIPVPADTCTQAVTPQIADTVTSVLTSVVTSGTGTGAALDRPTAGKTGTTNDSLAAWFVGYTPQLASAVWIGHVPSPQPGMTNITINQRYYKQVYGGTLPATIWRQAMLQAQNPLPTQDFAAPDSNTAHGACALVAATWRGCSP